MRDPPKHRYIDDQDDVAEAARALAAGTILAHAFGNFYAITTRPDEDVVRRVNLMKGRPAEQTGSVLTTRPHMQALFDWSQLPLQVGVRVRALMDDLFDRGPLGFRGPAAAHLPAHLTSWDEGIRTTQLIAPGYRCPCNAMLHQALERLPVRHLYVTSANRSRHQTGAEDEPAHFEADPLDAEFGREPDFRLLRHRDEVRARAAYSSYAPMSTTVLAFHRQEPGARPVLVVERHGSLPLEALRPVVSLHGFDLVLGPKAARRLSQRIGRQAA